MPKNICAMCRKIYDTKDITFDQRLIADENGKLVGHFDSHRFSKILETESNVDSFLSTFED